jgi:hypothetical protein
VREGQVITSRIGEGPAVERLAHARLSGGVLIRSSFLQQERSPRRAA